jgi:hypothetical protein
MASPNTLSVTQAANDGWAQFDASATSYLKCLFLNNFCIATVRVAGTSAGTNKMSDNSRTEISLGEFSQ